MFNKLINERNRVVIGDDAFDAAYTIYSNDPELVSKVINSQEVRKGLFRLREFTTIELNQDQLSLERTGRECEKDYLQFCFDIMSDLADAVERIR